MILNFRHKGLKRLYERGESKGLPAAFVEKLRRILMALDNASEPAEREMPGFGLHPLTADRAGS